MKIAVDGGGIVTDDTKKFGNAIFSENLLRALAEYDQKNNYFIYTLKKEQAILNKKQLFFQTLHPTVAWNTFRIPFEELISPKDIYLATNQAVPLFTSGKVITISHGLSFYFYKKIYKRLANKLIKQLQTYIKKSTYIVVSSQRIKHELLTIDGTIAKKIVVLPFGIPFDFETVRKQSRKPFFLFVGMNHPIKNIQFLLKVFNEFITHEAYKEFQLYLVGPFQQYESKSIKVYPEITRRKLRDLYQTTTAYLSPSLYESFNFPALEALSQVTQVICLPTAIIPEMQPYVLIAENEQDFLNKMKQVVDGNGKTNNLRSIKATFSWEKYVKKLTNLYTIRS